MVIDSRHRTWLVSTTLLAVLAIALYVWLAWDEPDGLGGGSQVGLIYGIVGGVLILYTWALTLLKYFPKWWWVGNRSSWLKGHLYLGTLSFLLILCHSGGRFGGTLEKVLYTTFGLTLLTGYLGLWLQQYLPRRLTQHVACEVPYEQLPQVCLRMQTQADKLFDVVAGAKLIPATGAQLVWWYDALVRPYLGWPGKGHHLLRDPARATEVFAQIRALPGVSTDTHESPVEKTLTALEMLCAERRSLAEQERLQQLLHGWLYLHVPLSYAMLVFLVVHVAVTLYY